MENSCSNSRKILSTENSCSRKECDEVNEELRSYLHLPFILSFLSHIPLQDAAISSPQWSCRWHEHGGWTSSSSLSSSPKRPMGSFPVRLPQRDLPQGSTGHVHQGLQWREGSVGSQTPDQDARTSSGNGTSHYAHLHSGSQVHDQRQRLVDRVGRTDQATGVALRSAHSDRVCPASNGLAQVKHRAEGGDSDYTAHEASGVGGRHPAIPVTLHFMVTGHWRLDVEPDFVE